METPEHERRQVEDYLRSQSGPDFEVEHVEKLTTEYVMGVQYDVWDAHTNEGRWWVITNIMNLYSQEKIKSMDIALSFHIGLMSRMMARQSRSARNEESWVLEVVRRLDVASDSLDRAKEVEDFQAVGMRLREALLTLAVKLADLGYQSSDGAAALQAGNFKGWANVAAGSVAAGGSSKELRSLLRSLSEKAWNYVSWLTHARNASESDARIALSVANQTIETFIAAVTRQRLGTPERCVVCASYQLRPKRTDDGDWVKLCATCGWTSPAYTIQPMQLTEDVEHEEAEREPAEEEIESPASQSECVEIEDFGVYLTPTQMRSMLEDISSRMASDADQVDWTNPFAFLFPEDMCMVDVHRLAFTSFRHPPIPGSELIYSCGESGCVNPDHASELRLPNESGWTIGIIEKVTLGPVYLELQVSVTNAVPRRVFVGREILDRYGFGDASSLIERVMVFSLADDTGWAQLIPGERRVDNGRGSIVAGWVHPPRDIDVDALCPCGGGESYGACHGRGTPS